VNLVAMVATPFKSWLIRVKLIENCPKIGGVLALDCFEC
jgi:hypothetical protein